MLTEIQKIILTCCLGPVDKTAWRRERATQRTRQWRLDTWSDENPRPYGEKEQDKAHEAYLENQSARQEYSRKYYKDNKEKVITAQREDNARRRKEDPLFRLSENIRSRVRGALKRAIAKKGAKTFHLVGCDSEQWMAHLESLFKPGMTWENYGPVWHVDHIKPCAKFDLNDPEQQKACFNWSNTQPLFAEENQRKGDKYAG